MLRIFLSVCETSSLSASASLFDVNQSTISYAIDAMRKIVGDPLFVKAGRGIVATERALALYQPVKQLVADIESLSVQTLSPEEATSQISISVAVCTPALDEDMAYILQTLRERSLDVHFSVTSLAPRIELERILAEDEADIGIALAQRSYPATLNKCPYGQDELAIFYDPEVRGPVKSLEEYKAAEHAMVSFRKSKTPDKDAPVVQAGIPRNIVVSTPAVPTLWRLMQGTDLITTMPKRLAKTQAPRMASCEMPFKVEPLRYDLVWHRRYEHSGRHTWLRALLLETSRALHGEYGLRKSSF